MLTELWQIISIKLGNVKRKTTRKKRGGFKSFTAVCRGGVWEGGRRFL
jgi:hypothetical protein